MGCTIDLKSELEFNKILTDHGHKGSRSDKFSSSLQAQESQMTSLNIFRGKIMTNTVVSGKNCAAIYKPTKILDSKVGISSPNKIAFSRNGMWAVTDSARHCVNIFDSQDELVKVIGNAKSQFKNPKGVVFDSDNHLYVVDSGNRRIQKFDISGNYLLQFSTKGPHNQQSSDPAGIAIQNDRVYVADSGSCHISVFQTDGQFCFTFGSQEFGGILDISITEDNHVLVSNWSDEGIHAFTLDGEFIGKFGKRGYYKTPLNYPYCLTTESNGFTLVAEYYNHRISVFDKEGTLVHSFGSKGTATGQFHYIEGIAISPNGSIYVSDNGNHRIQIF